MRTTGLLATLLAVALCACSGSKGSTGTNGMDGAVGSPGQKGAKGDPGADGTNGKNGTNGTNGTNGMNGLKGADGNDIILSENARTGLALAEENAIKLDLTGLNGDDVESVGRGAYLMHAVADCTGCHNGTDSTGKTLFLGGNVDFPIGGFKPGSPGTNCNVASPPTGCVDGHVFTRNLTPDKTTGLKLTEAQFVTVLRTGRDFKDATGGTTLMVMPWAQLRWLTDRDIHDLYHYLKVIPAVDNAVQSDVKPIIAPDHGPFFDSTGKAFPVPVFADGDVARPLPAAFDPMAGKPTAAAGEAFDSNNILRGAAISPLKDDALFAGLTPDQQALYGRGSYIVNGPGLCNECHTRGTGGPGGRNRDGTVNTANFLAGGQAFAVPPPLQPILGQVRTVSGDLIGQDHGFKLAFSMFLDTLLEGRSFTKDPTKPRGLGFPMPFDTFRNMTAKDKEAVYTYITNLQASSLVAGDPAHQAPARHCTTAAADCLSGESCTTVTINGMATKECTGAACSSDADCGACQACDLGNTNTCLAEDRASSDTSAADCVNFSF